jgi:uncharacterized RDD family membrane protein YckC
MSFGSAYPDDDFLTAGVMSRRCVGWVIDICLLAILIWVLWGLLALFGILTLGLGFGAMAILPLVPFCYHFFSLLSAASATPGQRIMGLTVRRNDDLGPPSVVQAFVTVICFYLTVATSGLLLLLALFTIRHRTLHDLAGGLVVVRAQALTGQAGGWNMVDGTPAR